MEPQTSSVITHSLTHSLIHSLNQSISLAACVYVWGMTGTDYVPNEWIDFGPSVPGGDPTTDIRPGGSGVVLPVATGEEEEKPYVVFDLNTADWNTAPDTSIPVAKIRVTGNVNSVSTRLS